jgi:hypothetical protein
MSVNRMPTAGTVMDLIKPVSDILLANVPMPTSRRLSSEGQPAVRTDDQASQGIISHRGIPSLPSMLEFVLHAVE